MINFYIGNKYAQDTTNGIAGKIYTKDV